MLSQRSPRDLIPFSPDVESMSSHRSYEVFSFRSLFHTTILFENPGSAPLPRYKLSPFKPIIHCKFFHQEKQNSLSPADIKQIRITADPSPQDKFRVSDI